PSAAKGSNCVNVKDPGSRRQPEAERSWTLTSQVPYCVCASMATSLIEKMGADTCGIRKPSRNGQV
ncbi:hypothetical protein JMJ77_0010116, partial [Colletotrichum scovillei]